MQAVSPQLEMPPPEKEGAGLRGGRKLFSGAEHFESRGLVLARLQIESLDADEGKDGVVTLHFATPLEVAPRV